MSVKKAKLLLAVESLSPEQLHSGEALSPVQKTNWALCALCQEEKKENLMKNTENGYKTLSINLPELHKYHALPLNINIDRLDDGSGIEQTLTKNNARWHKTCSKYVSKLHVQRAQKRKHEVFKENTENAQSADSLPLSPVKTRRCLNFRPEKLKETCLICDETDEKEPLINATTKCINNTYVTSANILGDRKLQVKLASGDMVAIEAKYHKSCDTKQRNKMRAVKSNILKEKLTGLEPMSITCEEIAFSQLLTYIEDCRKDPSLNPVFILSDLKKTYLKRLAQLKRVDIESLNENSTRFKNRLMEYIPDLRESHQTNKQIYLMFRKGVSSAMDTAVVADGFENAINLVKSVENVRKDIFQTYFSSGDVFQNSSQRHVVPESLLTLIKMLLYGSNIENQSECNESKDRKVTSLCELLYFNAIKNDKPIKDSGSSRHNIDKETPTAIYVAMLIHAKTRSKDIIDKLHNLGLCISYKRLMEIQNKIANSVCTKYLHDEVVCPPQLSNAVFTCSAVDNIDHNPSSTTAVDSFHGTAISLVQFPNEDIPVEESIRLSQDSDIKSNIVSLPQNYTEIPPVPAVKETLVPTKSGTFIVEQNIIKIHMDVEKKWLSHVAQKIKDETLNENDYVSWAAYHAEKQISQKIIPSTVALLPLFREPAHTASMMAHSMKIVIDSIRKLNPAQIPVITADQPLYAICKQLQYTSPETFGEDKILIMMGGLHIEMNILKLLGDWLRDSGWVTSLIQAEITTSGRAESMLSASHVTRTRYAHQVTAACLKLLQDIAHQQYLSSEIDKDNKMTFDIWHEKMCKKEPQFKYWDTTLRLELIMLQFIRSIRTRSFKVYVDCLRQIAPWLFALDHINYARWLPVHISDMINLSKTHPGIYTEFMKGNFAVQKTNKVFSAMAIDQSHEQMNKLLKGDGGVTGLTENPTALQRFLIAGPEICRIINDYEERFTNLVSMKSNLHHEQNPTTQCNFIKDVKSMVSTIQDMGNPFASDDGYLVVLDTKAIMSEDIVETVKTIEEKGEKQYISFLNTHLIAQNNVPLNRKIKLNKYPLFGRVTIKKISNQQQENKLLRNDCALLSKYIIVSQSRDPDQEELFTHENSSFPPALSEFGSLKFGKKSDLLVDLEKYSTQSPNELSVEAKVFDGAVLVHMLEPNDCKTFEEYALKVFVPYIMNQLSKVQRADVIWDRYKADSIKKIVREKRMGSNPVMRQKVLPNSPIPSNKWGNFLCVDDNKAQLFLLLSKYLQTCDTKETTLVTTYDEKVLVAGHKALNDVDSIQPCSHEEADTRIILHVAHCARQGYKKIAIKTTDTDVVVLAVSHFQEFNIEELWICFGTGKHFRNIPAHVISDALKEKARALMLFHALTGCDTVSFFKGKGKKSAWLAWNEYPSVTNTFLTLLDEPSEISSDLLSDVEQFVVKMYSKNCDSSSVNEARKELFASKKGLLNIPPTKGALLQHLKRAVFQASYIWAKSLDPTQNLPSPEQWGYKQTHNGWVPHWTDLPQFTSSSNYLTKCGCNKGCNYRCKCRKINLKCTKLCKCKGNCSTKS